MPINPATYLNDLRDFTVSSLSWCSQQAEAESMKVNDIVMSLVNEAGRRASMSEQALTATKFLQAKLDSIKAAKGHDKIGDLVKILDHIRTEHKELDEFTGPIVEALQFQDRLRQNLENVGKVLNVWLTQRSTVGKGLAADATIAYGKALLGCMTSQAERAVVRKFIPGLPEEETTEDALFF